MTGKASVPNVFASQTTVKTTDWDANWNSLVNYLNDPTNRISFSADTGAANAYVLAPSPVVAYSGNFIVWFLPAHSNTATSTAAANGLTALNIYKDVAGGPTLLVGGEIIANNWHGLAFDGTLNSNAGGWHLLNPNPASLAVYQNTLAGCTLSTAGSSATMTIASGQATSSDNNTLMTLTGLNKTTGGWAVGTGVGGLDTGSIANATWYHFYVIERLDTGVVDVVFSTSATTPTLPANYTAKRRIGAGLTDGSAHWTAFTQFGRWFFWKATVLDVNGANQSGTPANKPMTVPPGVQVMWRGIVSNAAGQGGQHLWVYNNSMTDEAASGTEANSTTSSVNVNATQADVLTDAAQNVRVVADGANGTYSLRTIAWYDWAGVL